MISRTKDQDLLDLQWYTALSDYITAIVWSPDGKWFAVSSAAGEVVQYAENTKTVTVLQAAQGQSIDVLAVSGDGVFLAAGGQAGAVLVWRLDGHVPTQIVALDPSHIWIDRLQWNPHYPELAYGFGRHVRVWSATQQSEIAELNFRSSSVLDLAWHPKGDRLSVSGNQNIKTWWRHAWDEAPVVQQLGGASEVIAWSPDGQYLASGNNDRSVMVWQDGNPFPWQMRGFPGKVRQLAWSDPRRSISTPLLASICGEGVVVWTKDRDPSIGWNAQVLDFHQRSVRAIAFQPQSLQLASVADDGWLCLWRKASRLTQLFEGAPTGFSCLAWQPSGKTLAAGGGQGEVLLWTQTKTGQGFG